MLTSITSTGRFECPSCGPDCRFNTVGEKKAHMRSLHPKQRSPRSPGKSNRPVRQGATV